MGCILSNNQHRRTQSCCYHRAMPRHERIHTQTHTHEKGTPAHSHACTLSHRDVKAIGCSIEEANSRCSLLMATGSRGAERDVDNDNVTPSQPALKNGTGHTCSNTNASLLVHLKCMQADTHTSANTHI